jgi:predicted nucleic acid-binding protein
MPDRKRIVINTGPILAIISAFDDLAILQKLYRNVLVPLEVCREIEAGGRNSFGVRQFNRASWLTKYTSKQPVSDFLKNSLDEGEASVIQLAIEQNISTVCIDKAVGRRIARLNKLQLTGSIGVLLKAKQHGIPVVVRDAVERMQKNGIWLSKQVVEFALEQAGER